MMKHEHLDAGPTEEQFHNMLQKAVLRHYPNPERKGCLDSETIATSGVMLLRAAEPPARIRRPCTEYP